MVDFSIVLWSAFIFVPISIFVFIPKWRFFAIVLQSVNLCFVAINEITLISNDNLWVLLQTEIEVSKSVFVVYQSALICLFVVLLCVAYKYIKLRVIIFIYFLLCNILLPFSVVEKFLFGKYYNTASLLGA